MSHPDAETLMRYEEGLLGRDKAAEVADHVGSCQDCSTTSSSMRTFAGGLSSEWLAARLRKVVPREWACPSESELSAYFLGEIDREPAERYEVHIEGCARCRGLLREMDQEAMALSSADPLGAQRTIARRAWLEWVRGALQPTPVLALVAVSVVACVAFMTGLLARPAIIGPPQPSSEVRIAKPPFTPPAESPALGVAPTVKPEAEQRFREAMTAYRENDFPDRAIPKLKKAVALDPDYEQAQFWLGIAHLLKGETTAAIRPLEEAVRLAPGKAQYKQYLVWAYLKVGRTGEALGLQTEVLERGRP